MKTIKFLLIAVLFVVAYSASAQWATNGTAIYNTNTGNVGIGTSTPTQAFVVSKVMVEPSIVINCPATATGGATIQMIDDFNGGNWKFKAFAGGGFKIRDQNSRLDVFSIEKNAMANAIYVKAGGNVGIGTNAPTSALTVNGTITSTGQSVNGKITCKEVEVTLDAFPDYVFDEEYHLSPLSEVEKYIKENKHLPGIPAAKEVIENGLSIGEMNVKMMEKIEELTLYVIQLQKQVNELKSNKN
jgi:hypothetical protein